MNVKQRIKLATSMSFKDYNSIIVSGLAIVVLAINALRFINGYKFFSLEIVYGNGIVFSIM